MEKKTYEQLIQQDIIKNVFNYDGLDNKINIYKSFESYFKSELDIYSRLFNIENAYFFICNDIRCNAHAYKKGKFNIISVTNGYPILLMNKLSKQNLQNIFLGRFKNTPAISNAFLDLENEANFEIDNFYLNCSKTFTFSHEFQHVLQFNGSKNNYTNFSFQEQLSKCTFDFKKHVWEFDADRMASYSVLKYTFSIFRKLKIKNNETLTALLLMACSSMILTQCLFYFGVANQIETPFKFYKIDFYLKEKSHPHPLVRCFNVLEYFLYNVHDDFPDVKISPQLLLNNVIEFIKIYFDTLLPSSGAIDILFNDLDSHLDNINQYNQELYDAAINDNSIKSILLSRNINFG